MTISFLNENLDVYFNLEIDVLLDDVVYLSLNVYIDNYVKLYVDVDLNNSVNRDDYVNL